MEDKLSKPQVNERAVQHNQAVLEYCRTSLSVVAGATGGVLGLTGLYGFALYFVYTLLLSLIFTLKVGSKWKHYFSSQRSIWLGGALGGLFTYVLLWTFVYGMVHVF